VQGDLRTKWFNRLSNEEPCEFVFIHVIWLIPSDSLIGVAEMVDKHLNILDTNRCD
jgi:hypothetical protein